MCRSILIFKCRCSSPVALTLLEYIYAASNELADKMDVLSFPRLRAWDATREQEKKKPRQRFIDEVWPGVKP